MRRFVLAVTLIALVIAERLGLIRLWFPEWALGLRPPPSTDIYERGDLETLNA